MNTKQRLRSYLQYVRANPTAANVLDVTAFVWLLAIEVDDATLDALMPQRANAAPSQPTNEGEGSANVK